MAKSKHDQMAERIAKKFGADYTPTIGIDVVTPDRAIEIETKRGSLDQGIRQVEHAAKARYIAVPRSLKEKAMERTKGTGIGVMTETGGIVKKASRKKW